MMETSAKKPVVTDITQRVSRVDVLGGLTETGFLSIFFFSVVTRKLWVALLSRSVLYTPGESSQTSHTHSQ
jgi:hypothetical protein